ncbi:MAG: DUF1848 family protein [Promethearchaeota archaeon]|nr:MAG: DUF1848 family protein [Candidatus Lokiarchaeota archaeon]
MNLTKSSIISCSRRTDIPAFLMDWVVDKIHLGYVDVVNPFNRKQIHRVSLTPEDVKCWVWWSKNFANWIKTYNQNRELFEIYKGHYFQFTINSPSELENGIIISLEDRFKQLEWLIKEFSSQVVNFRFDPIILYKTHTSNKVKSNLDRFEYIIENVSNIGLKEMIFSFATIYPKVKNRLDARGYTSVDPSLKKKTEILDKLIKICNKHQIKMKACCQSDLLKIEGIEQAHCIDAYKIEKITGESIPKIRDSGQRNDCGCYKAKDIGGYSGIFRCKHNCAYCYASPAKR